ncbi:MAG: hypothetical protein QGG40_02650, partial [Myxococcota bacterium]|nr:hypothetical protein [Myxococcota bacterium]
LDLTPDGTQAVVVARGSGELWVYDVADLFGSPEVITLPEDGTFGSVILSPDDTKGLLYSTATSESIYASWDRTDPDAETAITTHPLVKPVSQATISPTGGTALIFHPEENTDDSDPFYDDHYGISMVDLDSFLSNDYRLTGEPTAYADSDDGTHGFFVMEEEQYLQVLTYSSLILDEVELKSDPVHVGVLPDTAWAYVSQEHDLGRISFYDAETDDLNTITGFELNSGIEEY